MFWEECLRDSNCNTTPSLPEFDIPVSHQAQRFAEKFISLAKSFGEQRDEDEIKSDEPALSLSCLRDESVFHHIDLLTNDQQIASQQMAPATRKLFYTAIITSDAALSKEKSDALGEALVAIDNCFSSIDDDKTDIEKSRAVMRALLHAHWATSLENREYESIPPDDPIPGNVGRDARLFLDNFARTAGAYWHAGEPESPPAQEHQSATHSPPQYLTYRPVTLSDLNLGDEPPEQLITVPALGPHGLNQVHAPVDAASSGLTGREYLEFLTTDIRLMPDIAVLIEGYHVLNAAEDPRYRPRSAEVLNDIAERLRPVIAEAYRDPELSRKIDQIANETMTNCDDRFDFFLSQMENAALLAHLSRGDIDDTVLYNHGIAFFMLDEIRAATGRLYSEIGVNPANQDHSVHDHLNAVYYLQDELHLPHRHARPVYINNRGITIVGPCEARRIGEIVRERATENDGQRAIQYMATWDPWVAHLKQQDALERFPQFKQVTDNFQKKLAKMEERREIAGSAVHQMDPIEYAAKLGDINARYHEWIIEVAADLTKKFLINHRADYLAEMGNLPVYFR